MKKLSVNVAIAAYNAEQNIKPLVSSLLDQYVSSFDLKAIIVNSDSSTDKTVKIARSFKNKLVVVRESYLRQGFAGVVIHLLKKNDADVIVLLNDDIVITDKFFLEKTIAPFIQEKNVGLVCSNPTPFPGGNLMQRAITSSFNAYNAVRMRYNNGNSVLTCDGKVLTLSKQYVKSLKFPKDLGEMANVDWFIYFSCIQNGFKYRFVESARIWYKNPSTVRDYIKWTTRNNQDLNMMKARFGKLFEESYKLPKFGFMFAKVKEAIKNPVGCVLLFGLSIYCTLQAKMGDSKFETMWELVETTKSIGV